MVLHRQTGVLDKLKLDKMLLEERKVIRHVGNERIRKIDVAVKNVDKLFLSFVQASVTLE